MKCIMYTLLKKMKRIKCVYILAVLVVAGNVITACSSDSENDTKTIPFNPSSIQVTKAPDFNAYSGNKILAGATRSADVNGNLWYQNWERPINVTEAEKAKVVEEFSKKREGVKNTQQITWENFWVQQVYKGEATYNDGFGQDIGIASDKMNHLLVFNTVKEEVVSWWPYQVNYVEYEGSYEHINNFNSGDNQTEYTDDETHEKYVGTTLMTHIKSDGRDEQFAYHNSIDSKDHSEYIILEIDGAYYIGFDFYATHPDGQDANKNMDVERDWIFNDWIVKVCPAKMVGEDVVIPEGGYPAPTETGLGHVELNLSMNAPKENDDYLATKLSVHVRDTTDVEVFIPVPVEYYCDADDMNIVISHKEELEQHSISSSQVEYTINGHVVSATVSFEGSGIRIQTAGINAEVLEFLRTNYGDGVTFEVWNYYQNSCTREELKVMLDLSTITFTNEPEKYINAFAKLDGAVNPLDCTVSPPSSYRNWHANDGTTIGNYNVEYSK